MTKQIVKKTRKPDVKKVAKDELSTLIANFLRENGYEVKDNHEDFAFTGGTLIVGTEKTDVQVKFITPKSGLERYAEIVYVDEADLEAEETETETEIEA